ncbi:uncharacterized protein LOC116205241 [Punica granatum]|uniref:Uncharacterized protein LOC116205241 n=1 Tax=Punica granatum TaxID=22663 RepID=A0A6P8DAB6_PUNGR|nr:uncharacterized protein LOC116205241 [Punica granatum]
MKEELLSIGLASYSTIFSVEGRENFRLQARFDVRFQEAHYPSRSLSSKKRQPLKETANLNTPTLLRLENSRWYTIGEIEKQETKVKQQDTLRLSVDHVSGFHVVLHCLLSDQIWYPKIAANGSRGRKLTKSSIQNNQEIEIRTRDLLKCLDYIWMYANWFTDTIWYPDQNYIMAKKAEAEEPGCSASVLCLVPTPGLALSTVGFDLVLLTMLCIRKPEHNGIQFFFFSAHSLLTDKFLHDLTVLPQNNVARKN